MGNSGGTRLTLSVPTWDSAQDGLCTSAPMALAELRSGPHGPLGFPLPGPSFPLLPQELDMRRATPSEGSSPFPSPPPCVFHGCDAP